MAALWRFPMRSRVASTVVVLLAGVLLVSCGGMVDRFSFDTDDLCEWVSVSEVASFVERSFGWEAATEEAVEPADDDWECIWKYTNSDGEDLYVYAGEAEWISLRGEPIDLAAEEVVDFTDLTTPWVPVGTAVSGHPSVNPAVVVFNGGFGQFAFGVPPSDQFLQVWLSFDDHEKYGPFESRFFSVADAFIQELGWLPTTGPFRRLWSQD